MNNIGMDKKELEMRKENKKMGDTELDRKEEK